MREDAGGENRSGEELARGVAAVNVCQLMEEVITALTQWNATALELLSTQASTWIANPPTLDSLAASADQHRLLGALLQQTEHNLRMFRETSPYAEFRARAGAYEPRWSSEHFEPRNRIARFD